MSLTVLRKVSRLVELGVVDLTEDARHASMSTVVVNKEKLIETLRENRETHRGMFETALAGYRTRSIELLEEHIERIRKNKLERVLVALPMPEDHTDDYDKAIENLQWTIYPTVELTAREFDAYVRDKWAWKDEFVTSTAMYTGK